MNSKRPNEDQDESATRICGAETEPLESEQVATPDDQAATLSVPSSQVEDPFATIAVAPRQGSQPLPMIGNYEVLSELGRGGMGVVYKARQVQLNRIVAIKTIHGIANADPELVERFQIEAETSARLTHENIVPVIDFFEEKGNFYLVLGFIDGIDLEEKLKNGPLNSREAAYTVLQITHAIEYAHQRGVIHRDLKPANVMVDKAGVCYVSDFGLAKLIDAKVDLTITGQILGTPLYMSPEQASGSSRQTSTATDVYSLGAILYRCVSGRPPFQGGQAGKVLADVRSKDPAPPSRHVPEVAKDIDTICLKCLEKDPARRYGSAGELANELNRYLAGEPIIARPISSMSRFARYCKRKPAETALALATVFVLILGTALFATWFVGGENTGNGGTIARLVSNSQVLIWLSALGPVFSVTRGIGKERMRKLERYALSGGRAIVGLLCYILLFALRLSVNGAYLYLPGYVYRGMQDLNQDLNDEFLLLICTLFAAIVNLPTQWFLGWRIKMVLYFASITAIFVCCISLNALSDLSDSGVVIAFLSNKVSDNVIEAAELALFIVFILVAIVSVCLFIFSCWLSLTMEFEAFFRLLDATFYEMEEGFQKTIGFRPVIRYSDYRLGILFLFPFAIVMSLIFCFLNVILALLVLPFLLAERLRQLLTPSNPVFTDLLAYCVSVSTVVLLALMAFGS
jgi:tRNA A-37 threonylcarbamoyl transferase component Bud32